MEIMNFQTNRLNLKYKWFNYFNLQNDSIIELI